MIAAELPGSGLEPDDADTGLRRVDDGRRQGPVVVLGYAHSGAGFLRRLLSGYGELACTAGTGLLPLCDAAAATWQQVENRTGALSQLAIASLRALTGSLITTALAGTGRTRWCEIAYAHPRCADIFLQVYPAARFLFVHRNCLDVIRAGVQANPWGLADSAFSPFTIGCPGNPVAAIAAYWAASTEPLLDFGQAHPGSCYQIRYEDLIGRPDQARTEISAFLGLTSAVPAELTLAGDDLSPVGDLDEAQLPPVGRIPPMLMATVSRLMERIGYQPLPGSYPPP